MTTLDKLSKIAGRFHDGTLVDIVQQNDVIEISLISSEICDEEPVDWEVLNSANCIAGKLVLTGIEQVLMNDRPLTAPLKMLWSDGEVLDSDIDAHEVTLGLR